MAKLQPLQVVSKQEINKQAKKLEAPDELRLAIEDLRLAAKEGLLALSVDVGLKVLHELMEQEADEVVGPKGKHEPDRNAYRHGHEPGKVTLGGRRVPVIKPRLRTKDNSKELSLKSYEHFASNDPLKQVILERMLAGVSTRRYPRTQEPVGTKVEAKASSVSRSSLSRHFKEKTSKALEELLTRRFEGLELSAVMIDGICLQERTNVVALGITHEGVKVPLGLWEGSTENASVATALLADLQQRGLSVDKGTLVVIDGAKALAKAVKEVFGSRALIQRCQRHKERNVLDHLPESHRDWVRRKLAKAWEDPDPKNAKESLKALMTTLEVQYPGASKSLKEGLDETLTVTRLGLKGALKRTLASTNPIESMFSIVRTTQRNVKRWRSGEMALRWTAAGMLEAEKGFIRIQGYRSLPALHLALQRELHREEVELPEAA